MEQNIFKQIAAEASKLDSYDTYDYSYHFNKLAKSGKYSSEKEVVEVLELISRVCEFRFTPKDKNPFGPMFEAPGKRSLIPEDIVEGHLELLNQITNESLPEALMARMCDILWLRRRDPDRARRAISSYLVSAENGNHEDHWPRADDYLRRAIRIAKELGRSAQERTDVQKNIERLFENAISKPSERNGSLWPLALAEIMLDEFEDVNYEEIGRTCVHLGDNTPAVQTKDNYFNLAGYAFAKAQLPLEQSKAYSKCGGCWEDYANQLKNSENPNGLRIAHFLEKAIEAYRKGGKKQKAEELIQELQKAHLLMESQMQTIEVRYDISKDVKRVLGLMDNKVGMDAVLAYISLIKPPDYNLMLKASEEEIAKFPVSHLMPTKIVTEEGNTAARTEGFLTQELEELSRTCCEQYELTRSISAALLEAAREKLLEDKEQRWIQAISQLIENTSIISSNRPDIMLRCLRAGFEGDWLVFIHLVIPQIENLIRTIVSEAGGKTTSMRNGVMLEIGLNDLLFDDDSTNPVIISVLGTDLTWDLRTLLVVQSGPNLRNRLCHGLASPEQLSDGNVKYLLWLTLFMIRHIGTSGDKEP